MLDFQNRIALNYPHLCLANPEISFHKKYFFKKLTKQTNKKSYIQRKKRKRTWLKCFELQNKRVFTCQGFGSQLDIEVDRNVSKTVDSCVVVMNTSTCNPDYHTPETVRLTIQKHFMVYNLC